MTGPREGMCVKGVREKIFLKNATAVENAVVRGQLSVTNFAV